jgi:hypothetical protein
MAAPVLTPAAIARQNAEGGGLADESGALEDIYNIIFVNLRSPDCQASALADPLFTRVGSSRDLFIETVNMIAAAAAIARTKLEYDTLVELVCTLVNPSKRAPEPEPEFEPRARPPSEPKARSLPRPEPASERTPRQTGPARPAQAQPWDDLGFRLAEACLQRHLGQTNYFLLCLLKRRVFRPYALYKFVRNQGALRPLNTVLLLYFARELIELRASWFQGEWRRAVADMRESPRGFLSVLNPEYRTTRPEDWAGSLAEKRTGLDSGPLRIIAEDDVAAFEKAGLRPDAPVPYSPFNDFFHFQYDFKVTDGRLEVVGPTLMDAVGLFGAQHIFEYVMRRPSADDLIRNSINSLVAGTTEQNQFAQIAIRELGLDVVVDTLRDAIRWHNHDVLAHLFDVGVKFDPPAVDAVFRYSNLPVFISHREKVTEREEGADKAPAGPTVFHFMARGNSVHAFKTLLLEDPNAVDPYAVASDAEKRTFLHWAANYGAREVTRQWARLWGNRGFDALDAHNWNPSHYAFMTGLSDEPPPGGKGYGKYACSKPFYHYIVKRSELEYNPDTDPDVEEWPDAVDPAAVPAPATAPPAPPPLPDAPPDDAAGPRDEPQ